MRLRSFPALLIALLCVAGGIATAAPIHDAAASGDLAKVKKLVGAKPALVKSRGKDGATPLHYAVAGGHKAVVEFLLSTKADIEAKKSDGVRPMHVAAAMGRLDIVELLVANKADVNAVDVSGRTPLSIARQKANTSIAEFLVAHGANDAKTAPPAPSTLPAPQPPQSSRPSDELDALSIQLVQAVANGNYAAVTQHFDPTMKAALPPDKLGEAWNSLVGKIGPFKRIVGVKTVDGGTYNARSVTCEFANARLYAKIAYNASKQVSGFCLAERE